MSWHFSRALVEEYLEENSSDGGLFVLLNIKSMPQVFSCNDKMIKFYDRFLSGTMCKRLTVSHGEELLTWFLEGFPVKIYPVLTLKEKVSTETNLDSGDKCQGSFVKYDHIMSLWKTRQLSLFGGLVGYSETWPKWGMMRTGECWALDIVGQDIDETGFGYWPTLTKTEIDSTGSRKLIGTSEIDQKGRRWGTSLTTFIKSKSISKNGKLNPVFAELWMDWPLGWTELKELETGKYRQWLDSHGKS